MRYQKEITQSLRGKSNTAVSCRVKGRVLLQVHGRARNYSFQGADSVKIDLVGVLIERIVYAKG